MTSTFWDPHAILFINYLEKGQRINGESYIVLIAPLIDNCEKKTTVGSTNLLSDVLRTV